MKINVILSVLAKDLALDSKTRSFASTLRMTMLALVKRPLDRLVEATVVLFATRSTPAKGWRRLRSP